MQSNSPVAVGSVATFHAVLCNLSQNLLNKNFVYVWINNPVNRSTSHFDITTTASGTTASMSKVFSIHLLPGHYLMEVRAFQNTDNWMMAFEHLRPVAVGFHNFSLIGK